MTPSDLSRRYIKRFPRHRLRELDKATLMRCAYEAGYERRKRETKPKST